MVVGFRVRLLYVWGYVVGRASTVAFSGIDVVDVDVQAHATDMSVQTSFSIVGLPDKAIGESKERVRAALGAIGLSLPVGRITINLAPADLLKVGSHYDLAIALSLMVFLGTLPAEELRQFMVLGELSLDGRIVPVSGVLPASIAATERDMGIICPKANGSEAVLAGDLPVLAPDHLLGLINHFKGTQLLSRPERMTINKRHDYPDLRDIRGQVMAKRALEITAAGNHNMLMVGPPGSGKSMLASRLPGILPDVDAQEMLDISMIASVSGQLKEKGPQRTRPFRDPHHSCSMAAMVGGGKHAQPGEVTLAHRGVLFLDELPEFPRNVLDALRQPIETRTMTVSRAHAHVTYPADFLLIGAMNPCRCGYLGDAARACPRAPDCGAQYQTKISGPMLDRFDIHIDVPAVPVSDLHAPANGEGSKEVAERVLAARAVQQQRLAPYGLSTNSQLSGDLLLQVVALDDVGRQKMEQATERMGLTMRGYTRTLRLARTIADLEEVQQVSVAHLAEALSYREYYSDSVRV